MKTEQLLTATAGFVTEWTDQAGSDGVLRLQSGLELTAQRSNQRFKAWEQTMVLERKEKWPIYVEYDPATRIVTSLLLCTPRRVESIKLEQSGKTVVVFRRAPSFYFLNKDRANHDIILDVLSQGLRTGDSVLVAIHPTTLEVLWAQAQ